MNNRVVVTGLGVVSPNGADLQAFTYALKNGISGIRHDPRLEALQFSCQVAGEPVISSERLQQYFSPLEIRSLESTGIVYGVIAGMDAWKDAGLSPASSAEPDWDRGTVFGTGTSGIDKFRSSMYKIDALQIRKLGSAVVSQIMASAVSATLAGRLGLGNQVTTNSAACATGTESVLMAYDRIRSGAASIMLAGSTSDSGPYIWGGFDAVKLCPYKYNDRPEAASRPMSSTASGFVPGSGAGALVLENLENALARGAKIYGEVLGGHTNSGGQRGEGSMTAQNNRAVQRCITQAMSASGISADQIDLISGHLTATTRDAAEIENWVCSLNRKGRDFPYLNSIKGMIGHCLSAAGSIECVAAMLQLSEGFVFPNLNCEDLQPEITALVDTEKIPQRVIGFRPSVIAKASFGFGDVNACVIFKTYPPVINTYSHE